MAFIENFQKLVRTIGGQQKIQDKDKAILEIAEQIVNGGGGQEVEEQIQMLETYLFGSNERNRIDGALKIKYKKSNAYGTVTDINILDLISIYNDNQTLDPLSDANCSSITEIPLCGLVYRANQDNKPMFAHFTGVDIALNYPANTFNNLYMLRAFVKTDGTIAIKNELLRVFVK